jgi:hypothetical protein
MQGTLREALDGKRLLRNSSNGYLPPTIMLSLAHDIAAALLHLHSEGESWWHSACSCMLHMLYGWLKEVCIL